MRNTKNDEWNTSDTHVFWGEIAPTEHVVQIYETDEVFLGQLEEFVVSGFKAGDCVAIIATHSHINQLKERLTKHGFDTAALINDDQFIPEDAEQMLSKFMVNGWPDAKLFHQTIDEVVKRAKQKGRRLRAFGEMVAVLWGQGLSGATVHLEALWNRYCETEAFCLFCAYPKAGFTQDPINSLNHICASHSKMISGIHNVKAKVFYKPVLKSA